MVTRSVAPLPLLFFSVGALLLLLEGAECFQLLLFRNRRLRQGTARTSGSCFDGRGGSSSTALSMGIRDMLGGFRKGKRRGSDGGGGAGEDSSAQGDDDSGPSEGAPASSAKSGGGGKARAPAGSSPAKKSSLFPDGGAGSGKTSSRSSSSTSPPPPPTLRMGEHPLTKEVDVHALDQKESVQERINRVKSGKMTDFEKQAFLQTALTAGNTAESRKPLIDPTYETESNKQRRQLFASPFPSDSILRNFASGGAKNSEEEMLSAQKRKQEYLDMVTNPDRFNRYRTYGGSGDEEGGEGGGDQQAQQQPPKDSNGQAQPADLGARLGAAAMANENLRQQERQREQEQEQRRLEYERRAEELAKTRRSEMQQFEVKQAERRKMMDSKRQQEQDAQSQAEKERLEQLMRAQDEYWTRKLAEERKARAERSKRSGEDDGRSKKKKSDGVSMKRSDGSTEGTEDEDDATAKKPKGSVAAAGSSPPSTGTGNAKAFNPDESNLLTEAEHKREDTWEHNQDIIDRSASRITGRAPEPPPHPTESEFLAEQARRKAEIDRAREVQLQRLREFNSPLPNAVKSSPQAPGGGFRPPPATAVVPRSGASAAAPPRPSPAGIVPEQAKPPPPKQPSPREGSEAAQKASGSQPSAGLFGGPAAKVPTKPVSPSSSDSSATSEKEEVAQASPAPPPTPPNPKPATSSASPKKTGWSFMGLTGNSGNKKSEAKEEATVNEGKVEQPAQQPQPQQPKKQPTPPSAERKGPIRMQLPLGDDDDLDDGDEEGVDVQSNKKMSIAEAMKRTTDSGNIDQSDRSKKWGIDINKFL